MGNLGEIIIFRTWVWSFTLSLKILIFPPAPTTTTNKAATNKTTTNKATKYVTTNKATTDKATKYEHARDVSDRYITIYNIQYKYWTDQWCRIYTYLVNEGESQV